MADNRPIGIFDSGLGGLTVMREIVKLMPNENIVYFGDTGRVPYGTRSRETITKYAIQDEKFLIEQNVKLIVAACGTVSSVASATGTSLPVPFFEVISHTVKAAVNATKNGKIGVIGTSATINSGEHRRQILKLLPTAEVFCKSCTLFVPFVEEGWIDPDNAVVMGMVKKYLEPLIPAQVDTLILGCTHYPILSPVISRIMGEKVTLINAGEATAAAVKDYLETGSITNDNGAGGIHRFYVSDKTNSFETTAQILLGKKINKNEVNQVDIDKYEKGYN